jgi:hypothetical protein
MFVCFTLVSSVINLIYLGQELFYYTSMVQSWHIIIYIFDAKLYSGVERLARDKRSSLLWKFITYGRKKFYNIAPGHQDWGLASTFWNNRWNSWLWVFRLLLILNHSLAKYFDQTRYLTKRSKHELIGPHRFTEQ